MRAARDATQSEWNWGKNLTRLRNISLIALTALFVCAAPALAADSPVNDAYGSTTTSLPFSGLDLGLIVLGGVLLLALGFGLRRATRTQ